MIFLRWLLFPFALLYDAITRFRNHLYDTGHKRSFRFEVPIIGVGNLNVGGSGKTPMIEYLVRLLMTDNTISILSRGYGRTTRGLRFAKDHETARTLGDEPLQFFRSFKEKVNVVVCEDRAFAIPHILQEFTETNLILMDDSFQHRPVDPKLSILLTEQKHPFYTDFVMPTGNLREARKGAARADAVVVTKCDAEISEQEMKQITSDINRLAPAKPVFFTRIQYGKPLLFEGHSGSITQDVILVSGIANHKVFEAYANETYKVAKHFSFKDHHRYSKDELSAISKFASTLNKPVSILTTEKDMVRLIDQEFSDCLNGFPWFYLPIETLFIKDGLEFDELVKQAIQS